MTKHLCPKCSGSNLIKVGFYHGKQKYKCNVCGRWFTEDTAKIERNIEYRNENSTLLLDKKIGEVNFREVVSHLQERQRLHDKASYSQSDVHPYLKTKSDKIIILPLSDLHIGALGTDYELLLSFNDFLLKHDSIYTILVGDIADNFVSFKNKLAMHQMILSPEEQDQFVESWIKEIKHKILSAFWGNHEEMEERASGRNAIKRILSHNVPYVNGIGRVKLNINNEEYRICATHKTRYYTSLNMTHGLKRLAQMELPDEDIYIAGDKHVPDMEVAFQRGQRQTFLQLGTLKTEDSYSKRYFSYFTSSAMPCVALDSRKHQVTPFWTLDEAMEYVNA